MLINPTCLTQVFSDLLLVTKEMKIYHWKIQMAEKFIGFLYNVDNKWYFHNIKIATEKVYEKINNFSMQIQYLVKRFICWYKF